MISEFDAILEEVTRAEDGGLSQAKIVAKILGKSAGKDKVREAELRDWLVARVREGVLRGPFATAKSKLYFAAGRGPSIESVGARVERLVSQSGVKQSSKATLEKKIAGLDRRFFADAVADAIARKAILEVVCGRSKYYLHRDVAVERLGFGDEPAATASLTFADLLPIYRRLKAEQSGFSTVKIFDVIEASGASKAEVHRVLVEEAKAGRVALHPTTSVGLPPEVVAAGVRLPGFAEPFITVVVKDGR